MLELLREKPLFGRFMLGRLLSSFADQLLLFCVPLLVYQTTGSVARSGLTFFIEWLPRVISLPLAGATAGRFGGLRVFWTSDLIRGVSCLSAFTVLYFSDSNNPDLTFMVLSLLSAIVAFFYSQAFVSLESLVPKIIVNPEQLPTGQSLLQWCEQASAIAGPLIAGLFSLWVGKLGLIAAAGALFVLGSVNSGHILLKNYSVGVTKYSVFQSLSTGLHFIRHQSIFIFMVTAAFFMNLMIGTVMALNPALCTGHFQVSDQTYSLLNSCVGFSSLVSLSFLPRLLKSWSIELVALISIATLTLGGFFILSGHSFGSHVIGYSMVLSSVSIFNVYMRSTRAKLVPTSLLPQVIGIMVFMNQLAVPLSGLLVSIFSRYLSVLSLLRTSVIVSLPLLVFFSFQIKKNQKELHHA